MKAEKDYFQACVAEKEDDKIIGMAFFYYVYYTWAGKSMYLDDLYVKKEYRGHKIGSRLLDKVLQIVKENNCNPKNS